jgi:hypothetical protein
MDSHDFFINVYGPSILSRISFASIRVTSVLAPGLSPSTPTILLSQPILLLGRQICIADIVMIASAVMRLMGRGKGRRTIWIRGTGPRTACWRDHHRWVLDPMSTTLSTLPHWHWKQ